MQAYPAIYSWTTYPLTALIEFTWEAHKKLIRKEKNEKDLLTLVGLIEVTACAERALNFMHTGNPAVIKTSIMNPLWIGRAIVNDGLPSFNQKIVELGYNQLRVSFAQWPFDDGRNLPKSTAESALRYRYNEQTVAVSAFKVGYLSTITPLKFLLRRE